MAESGDRRLDGWQAIADHLRCHPRTVIRWEREHGLPVHRVQGSRRSPVYAFTAEIDTWLKSGKDAPTLPGGAPPNGRADGAGLTEEKQAAVGHNVAGDDFGATGGPVSSQHAVGTPRSRGSRRFVLHVAISVIIGAGGLEAFRAWANRPVASPRLLDVTAITRDARQKSVDWLATDGPRIFFAEGPGRFMAVGAGGGEATPLALPAGFDPGGISPDGLNLGGSMSKGDHHSLWVWPIEGTARQWGSLSCQEPTWSPDGSAIACVEGRELMVAGTGGSNPRMIARLPGDVGTPRWSPGGKLLRFSVWDSKVQTLTLWEVGSDGADTHELLKGWNTPPKECCGNWTPDGRWYVFQSTRNGRTDIWALPSTRGFLGPDPKPVQLTPGPISFHFPTPSRDGKRLFVIGEEIRPQLEIFGLKPGQLTPYLGELEATQPNFSRDGKWLAYVHLPDHTLWRSRPDGSDRQQLTSGPLEAREPYWSPDDRQIAFLEVACSKHYRIGLVPSSGGEIQHPVPGVDGQGVPTWSHDGARIVFGEPLQGQPIAEMALHVYDFRSRLVTTLPDSNGLWTPRWSPDGRYIAALRLDLSTVSRELKLFENASQKWRSLVRMDYINEPTWSRDGRYIYFDTMGSSPALYRVGVTDAKLEPLKKLEGGLGPDTWSGVTPDGSPLITRDVTFSDVYALRVNWP